MTGPVSQAPATGPVGRVLAWAGDGLAAVSTLLIAVLMLIICADAVARNTMGASLPLVSELGASLLVAIVYLALATTIRANRLARTDMVLGSLARSRPRIAALLSTVYDLIGAILLALVCWAGFLSLAKEYRGDLYIGIQGVLTFPSWPFGLAFVLGLGVSVLQFLHQSWLALTGGRARTGGGLE
jgi:TRAP-type C4-dicarboxylate transport system permease small subunit